ncbi:MAG: general stress protein [Acidimicrobiales bacterium]
MSEIRQPDEIPPRLIATFPRYTEVQEAVDHLSDEGFAVSTVSIIWAGLRKVEYVTGRRTALTAARQGGLSGAYFGLFAGFLLSLFVELDEDVSVWSVVITWVLVAAAVGAAWSAFGHFMQRGRRDFSAVDRLEAERYELWIDEAQADRAVSILTAGGLMPPSAA